MRRVVFIVSFPSGVVTAAGFRGHDILYIMQLIRVIIFIDPGLIRTGE
jgi:hypothetical protein